MDSQDETLPGTGVSTRPGGFVTGPDPTSIGRFEVRGRLGHGGMGVVYDAYDSGLDRRVAIKLLRESITGEVGEMARERLLEEARAMAKVVHENVVPVYEIGSTGQRVFVAMQAIEGVSLRAWQTGEGRADGSKPDSGEILSVYLQAAAGLQAAHDVGLVHRDFKPENVLVDRRGRPRVLDFGIAAAVGDADTSMTHGSREEVSGAIVLENLQGTPAYMSPEQFANEGVDARSDQFSFCISLYEALVGERPFAGDGLAVARNVCDNIRRPVPAGALPEHIRQALERGLSPDPDERFESMRQLAAALRNDPRHRRRQLLGLSLAATAVAAAIGGSFFAGSGQRGLGRCEPKQRVLRGTWDEEVRGRLSEALGSGPDALASLESFDGYGERWTSAYDEVCEDTSGRRSGALAQKEAAATRHCLSARLDEFSALVRAAEEVDDVDALPLAVHSLEPIGRCLDPERLAFVPDPPDSLFGRAAAMRRIEHASILQSLDRGRVPDALARSEQAVAEAHELEFDPLVVDALITRAWSLWSAGETAKAHDAIRQAATAAERVGDPRRQATAAAMAVAVAVEMGVDAEAVEDWLDRARAAAVRLGPFDEVDGWIRYAQAEHAVLRGELSEAVPAYGEAVALWDGPGQPRSRLALALHGLGTVHETLAETAAGEERRAHVDAALAAFEREQAVLEEGGTVHPPRAIQVLLEMSHVERMAGDPEHAAALVERARALAEGNLGQDSPLQLQLASEHAAVLEASGALQPAESLRRMSVERAIALAGPDSDEAAQQLWRLARNLVAQAPATNAPAALELIDDAIERRRNIHTGSELRSDPMHARMLRDGALFALLSGFDPRTTLDRAQNAHRQAEQLGLDDPMFAFVLWCALDETGKQPVRADELRREAAKGLMPPELAEHSPSELPPVTQRLRDLAARRLYNGSFE